MRISLPYALGPLGGNEQIMSESAYPHRRSPVGLKLGQRPPSTLQPEPHGHLDQLRLSAPTIPVAPVTGSETSVNCAAPSKHCPRLTDPFLQWP